MKCKAIFLDHDGTINVEKDYLFKIEDFEFLHGVIPALRIFQEAGYKLIIITNQSGIARGYYKEEDFHRLNAWMLRTLEDEGIHIDSVLYCPHHPNAKVKRYRLDCDCRKPKLGLYKKAISGFNIDLSFSFAIGDKIRDCAICESTDCRGYLISLNETPETLEKVKAGEIHNVSYATDLLEAAQLITATNVLNTEEG